MPSGGGGIVHVTYDFQRLDAPGDTKGQFDWTAESGKTIDIDLNLPSGFYYGGASATIPSLAAGVPGPQCVLPMSFGLLSGTTRTFETFLNPVQADYSAPPLLLMGTVPKNYALSIVRYKQSVPCDGSTRNVAADSVSVETAPGGYYGYVYYAAPFELGLMLRASDGRTIVFRVIASHPRYARFDITQSMIDDALRAPAGTLVCM